MLETLKSHCVEMHVKDRRNLWLELFNWCSFVKNLTGIHFHEMVKQELKLSNTDCSFTELHD